MIQHTIETERFGQAQIEWAKHGPNPFRQVFGTGPEFLWVGNNEREDLIRDIIQPVIEAIWRDAKDNSDPFTEAVFTWKFYQSPWTHLRYPDGPVASIPDEEWRDIEYTLRDFEVVGPFTVWGWWHCTSDGVGGQFGTDTEGNIVVLFS